MLLDSDRLLGTVEQVLKAGRAGHKRAGREFTQVDFGSLVKECIDLASTRHHLQPGALYLDGFLSQGNASVTGDPEELRTAVSNLLDNAVKYSGNQVDVAVQLETPDARHVVLRVRDHGVGIPRHELKRIFRRFYRVPNRSVSQVKGTGLGLFIVRSIARKHGGKVSAESEGEGLGTTVTLELPRSAS